MPCLVGSAHAVGKNAILLVVSAHDAVPCGKMCTPWPAVGRAVGTGCVWGISETGGACFVRGTLMRMTPCCGADCTASHSAVELIAQPVILLRSWLNSQSFCCGADWTVSHSAECDHAECYQLRAKGHRHFRCKL